MELKRQGHSFASSAVSLTLGEFITNHLLFVLIDSSRLTTSLTTITR